MDISTEINILLLKSKVTQTKLANLLGTSQGNLANKFSRNNWRINEVEEIANLLGYHMKIDFTQK